MSKKRKVARAGKSKQLPLNLLLMLSLGVLSFIIYGNCIGNGLALDDLIVLSGNQFTQKGIAGIPDIMTHDAFVGAYGEALNLSGGRYRPLSIVMLAIEVEFFGMNSGLHHFINVLLFALTSVLIFLLISKFLPNENNLIPFLSALFFLIHPIHTEVVANIKSRDEILMLLLCLLSTYILFSKKSNGRLFLAAMLYFLGLLSKENAITFMAIIPLALLMFKGWPLKKIALTMLPFLAVSIIYLVMRDQFAGMIGDRVTTDIMDDPYMRSGLAEKMATIMLVLLYYLKLLVFPHPLSYDYSYNQIPTSSFADPLVILSVLIHLGLMITAFVLFNKQKTIAFGIIFYFATIFIVSNIVFNIGTSMAERFLYLPSLGFCMVMAVLIRILFKLPERGTVPLRAKWILPMLIIIALASVKTIARNKDWQDNYTLYKADYLKVPNSARARLYYGIELISRYNRTQDPRDIAEAIEQIKLSAEINPEFTYAYHNLGVAYQKINNHDEAIECYQKLLELEPDNANALYGLGISYGKGKEEPLKAITYLEKLFNGKFILRAEYYDNLGLCYAVSGNSTKAVEIFKEGNRKFPGNAKLLFNLGVLYSNTGKADSAAVLLEQAFAIDPSLKNNRAR